VVNGAGDGGVQFRAERLDLRAQVEVGNRFRHKNRCIIYPHPPPLGTANMKIDAFPKKE
jgi:hypothetical protein